MKNLQLTERGVALRAVLEKLSAMLAESNYEKPIVMTRDTGPTFVNGWDMGSHYGHLRALQRSVTDMLAMGLPEVES